jgi:tRNA U34 5-methylaminomethyl-2-thiouridine-forming methyltransferase MnmC
MNHFMSLPQGVVLTKDGSLTFWSEEYRQHYHSIYGAVQESEHVFFQTSGCNERLKDRKSISIFESGFGTGTNFFMAARKAKTVGAELHFMSVEKAPLPAETIRTIGGSRFETAIVNQVSLWMESLHPGWNQLSIDGVSLHLFFGDFAAVRGVPYEVDFFFHDAFSPETNPDLWTREVFERLRSWAKSEAVLTTYAASVSARAAMAAGGWLVARADGAPGKREMTIAGLRAESLSGFRRVNEARLAARWNAGEWVAQPGS